MGCRKNNLKKVANPFPKDFFSPNNFHLSSKTQAVPRLEFKGSMLQGAVSVTLHTCTRTPQQLWLISCRIQ